VLAALALGACSVDATTPDGATTADLRVDVVGGIAAADYTFDLLDDGSIVGVHCTNMCNFEPGDTLSRLTQAQRISVRNTLIASGLLTAGRPVDFGEECCDQFYYRVIFSSGAIVRSFSGSIENFPAPLQVLVRTLHLVYLETPPVIMSQTKGLEGYSTDAVGIADARVVGGVLEVDVTYSGGCTTHDLDAVAWTPWTDSTPVQVGIAVTHDAHGDSCEAAVQRTLLFDLEALRVAYVGRFFDGPATLLLRVEPAKGAPGAEPRVIEFSF